MTKTKRTETLFNNLDASNEDDNTRVHSPRLGVDMLHDGKECAFFPPKTIQRQTLTRRRVYASALLHTHAIKDKKTVLEVIRIERQDTSRVRRECRTLRRGVPVLIHTHAVEREKH